MLLFEASLERFEMLLSERPPIGFPVASACGCSQCGSRGCGWLRLGCLLLLLQLFPVRRLLPDSLLHSPLPLPAIQQFDNPLPTCNHFPKAHLPPRNREPARDPAQGKEESGHTKTKDMKDLR